ncbi:enamine deaminase RidA (YjgF/YER057c/UK114 family) [Pararhizobium capsulatum DSM 1112]|uniref:Enamine deaminase RidA (YjgF/YER057c/UK114 family) n=1 Tax=Pararhizobium capsulatum DSM 1112 TaxID=1121113 RepID=A0ABU0C2H2_9HYPH|nr:Rid family hydrolase [Pararhizobium capsulatum]MDQ0323302.1 enamine deaminase RidA (YjgF/YER057c/UK114 family) [Pararhizobium capsulatum DSM 1112]
MHAAGRSLSDVVQIQAYLIDKTDAAGFNRVYREFFRAPYPVPATVVVDLLSTDIRLEIMATAVV